GLVGRQRDGTGRAVTVTGLHAAGAALATLAIEGIDVEKRASPRSLRGGPFYRLYQGSDGTWFHLAALSPSIFFRALDAVGRMDLLAREDVGGEFSNLVLPAVSDAVNSEMEKTFATAPTERWLEVLRAASVPAARVLSRQEWMDSEMSSAITGWDQLRHPDVGLVRVPAFPISFNGNAAAASASPPPPVTTTRPTLPLTGVRVIDISTFLAAPFSATLLATAGADVIKVEPPEGDPYRVHNLSYAVANQHKRAMALNLKDDAQRDALLKMVGASDVLVDNFREGGLDRLGLDDATLGRGNPGLVRCSVSAFGTGNPWSALPGFDPVLQSTTGMAVAQGGASRPAASAAPVVDVTTGSLAALGILAALYSRSIDGRGQHVRTSLAAGAVFVQSAEMTTYESRPEAAVGGLEFAGPAAERHYYRTLDGWLAVSAITASQRQEFHRVVGAAGDIAAAIEREPTVVWVDRLAGAGVPAAEVLLRKGALSDPVLDANGVSATFSIGEFGRFRVIGAFGSWAGTPDPPRRSTDVGADTGRVLSEFGLTV
ncbi:MAG: CoA transferase, partial [Acidimicrobiaceae bacterium]|nr:CoA transferase [Acidimicrobiaceae bacterium]